MATGAGKTYTACNFIYRLIKHAGARRVLFLVDRSNLGRQTLKEFQSFRTPEEQKLFTELYNVQHLQSNKLDSVSKICITTIQRLYSMLKGKELDSELEEQSATMLADLQHPPEPVDYNPSVPIETFDFIVTDECHRSIYGLWRQVLEYFDASIIGLTATPSKQTIGFFNQNLVMEYGFAEAVADGVNVDFDLYQIRTMISEHGSIITSWRNSRRAVTLKKAQTTKSSTEVDNSPISTRAQSYSKSQNKSCTRAVAGSTQAAKPRSHEASQLTDNSKESTG